VGAERRRRAAAARALRGPRRPQRGQHVADRRALLHVEAPPCHPRCFQHLVHAHRGLGDAAEQHVVVRAAVHGMRMRHAGGLLRRRAHVGVWGGDDGLGAPWDARVAQLRLVVGEEADGARADHAKLAELRAVAVLVCAVGWVGWVQGVRSGSVSWGLPVCTGSEAGRAARQTPHDDSPSGVQPVLKQVVRVRALLAAGAWEALCVCVCVCECLGRPLCVCMCVRAGARM